MSFAAVNEPHAATGLLKLYLRELPEPLLTFPLFNVLATLTEQGALSHACPVVERPRGRGALVVFTYRAPPPHLVV